MTTEVRTDILLSDGIPVSNCLVCDAATNDESFCSLAHLVKGTLAIEAGFAPSDPTFGTQPVKKVLPDQSRGGSIYDIVRRAGKWADMDRGTADLDDIIGWLHKYHKGTHADRNTVRRAHIRHQEIQALALAKGREATPPKFVKMLGPPIPATADKQEVDKWIKDAAKAFTEWRGEFFKTANGDAYITPGFQRKWVAHWMKGFASDRKRRGVLSPPRSGKTDLLVHLITWLILRNPNIRIVWVGPNSEIAQNSVDAVREILSSHDKLIETYLPPGGTFKPAGAAAKTQWAAGAFTVANRTVIGQKASTLLARGRTGRLLSLDADLIIADDVVDFESMLTEGARKQVRGWFLTSLSSRASATTAFFVIGSRVHPQDLYQTLLDAANWSLIVERAHSIDCQIDEYDVAAHDAAGCLLAHELPDLNYQWLLDKKLEAEAASQPEQWELVYQNDITGSMSSEFLRDEIRECFDITRKVGLDGLAPGYELIAGLDPAFSGHQAAFLMAFWADTGNYAMVDLENPKGGGIDQFLNRMKDWYERFGVRTWIVETNAVQAVWLEDPRVKEYARQHHIDLHGHKTTSNRASDQYGVIAMARLFRDKKISLPYDRDPISRKKVDLLERQLLSFDVIPAGKSTKALSDVVMAMWFTYLWARKIAKRTGNPNRNRVHYQEGASYPGVDTGFTDFGDGYKPTVYPY